MAVDVDVVAVMAITVVLVIVEVFEVGLEVGATVSVDVETGGVEVVNNVGVSIKVIVYNFVEGCATSSAIMDSLASMTLIK